MASRSNCIASKRDAVSGLNLWNLLKSPVIAISSSLTGSIFSESLTQFSLPGQTVKNVVCPNAVLFLSPHRTRENPNRWRALGGLESEPICVSHNASGQIANLRMRVPDNAGLRTTLNLLLPLDGDAVWSFSPEKRTDLPWQPKLYP